MCRVRNQFVYFVAKFATHESLFMKHAQSNGCFQKQFINKEELYLDEVTNLMKRLKLSDFETKSTQFAVKKTQLHQSLIPLHRTKSGECDCCESS